MTDLKTRRAELLGQAREIVEKARDEHRGLSSAEQDQVDAGLNEVRSIDAKAATDTRAAADTESKQFLSKLDAMAAGRYQQHGDGTAHLALTGEHGKAMARRIVEQLPRDPVSGKALVAGGTSTVSTILLPEIAVTGRPALSILDLLPTRIVPSPSYFFLRQTSRALAAAPVPAYGAKPVSDAGVTGIPNRLRVVATVSNPVDIFLLADNTNLGNFVADECVYAVRLSLETEILSGDGSGEHMTGILNTSGVVTQAFVTSNAGLDSARAGHAAGHRVSARGHRAVHQRLA
jgi:HK97 family phage major capsid protein